MRTYSSVWITEQMTPEEYRSASDGWTNDYSYEQAQQVREQFSVPTIAIPVYREQ